MIRFGLIGCGVIGRYHAQAISDCENTRLVAVADIDEARAAQLAQDHQARATTDMRELLDSPEINAVSICTASGLHAEQALAAIAAGKHVLVEKPLATTVADCRRVREAARAAHRTVSVIFQNRFRPVYASIKRSMERGEMGTPVLATAHLKWYRSQEYFDTAGWRGTWEMDGGGALMNQAIHYIDLLRWIMGPVESVFGYTATRSHKIETEDVATATLQMRSGALATIVATTSAIPGLWTRLEIHGSSGSYCVQNDVMNVRFVASEQTEPVGPYGLPELTLEPYTKPDYGVVWHQRQIEDFARAIEAGTRPLIDADEGSHAVQIINAIYASERTGTQIFMSDFLSHHGDDGKEQQQ